MGLGLGFVGDVGGALVGGLLGNKGSRESNRANARINAINLAFNRDQAIANRNFNSIEAYKDRQWQQFMSSSAHQRAVQDLRKAGLNPILSAQNPASTPGGAQAHGQAASATPPIPIQNELLPSVNSAMSIAKGLADINLANARTALTEAQETLSEQLIPGAEAISTVTEQVRNLAEAAVNLIGKDRKGYTDMLNEIRGTITELLVKAHENGVMPTQIINNIYNGAVEASEGARKFLKERINVTDSYFNTRGN
jgi:hypothetical protein